MNIRKEWLSGDNTNSDSSPFYSAEETINEVVENFNIRRYYSTEGSDLSVDGINCRAIVQYFSNPLNKVRYDREMHVPMDINVRTGSLIDYKNKKWLVVSSIDDLQAYKSAGIVETNNILTLNKNGASFQIPCIISSQISLNTTLSVDESKFIQALYNEIFIRVSVNSQTNLININEKFKIGRFSYQVDSISDIIENGLLVIKLHFIADEVVTPTRSLIILNGTSIQVNQNDSLAINIQVVENNIVISPTPEIIYETENENILTVNNIGIVTIVGIGTTNIICKFADDISIQNIISVEVVSVPIENKYAIISGNVSIIKNYTETYSCVFNLNGVNYLDDSVFYIKADDGVSETDVAQIISQDASLNTCIIKGSQLGYVKLFVKNTNNTVVSEPLRIKIENLF